MTDCDCGDQIQNGQVNVLELVSRDRDVYLQAQESVQPTGERLDMAAANYAEAVRIIGTAGPVVEAARFFAKHYRFGSRPKRFWL